MYARDFVPREAVSGEVAGIVRVMRLGNSKEAAGTKSFIWIGSMRRSKNLQPGMKRMGGKNKSSISKRGREKSYVFF